MRRWLLTTTAGLAVLALHAVPAHAQIVTISPAEITKMLEQLQQMRQDYEVYKGIFGSLLRVIDPNSMATGLIGQNSLPAVPQVSQMIAGGGNFGALSGAANQFLQANTIYKPTSLGAGDFSASLLQRNGNTLAGAQAMVQQSMASIETHIAGVADIQRQLSTVQTDADIAAINGRLQAEQANLAAQGVQAQSISTMLAAQQQQYQLQQEQLQRKAADDLAASAGGNGVASSANPTLVSANTVPTFSAPVP